ncbi:MAG TPA: hypothetical protein VGE52_07165 [Pirellulales bacterium]
MRARLMLAAAFAVAIVAPLPDGLRSLRAADAPPEPVLTARLETLTLKSGETFSGWVKEETDAQVRFKVLLREPNKAPSLKTRSFAKKHIDKLERLDADDRAMAERSVDRWLREVRGRARSDGPVPLRLTRTLGPATWEYDGAQFSVQSTSDEATVRAVAMRLEQRWAALTALIPPVREPAEPLRIVIWGSSEEYQAQLRTLGASLSHRAFYAPADHLIVARTDLGRVSAEIQKIKAEHAQVMADFKRQAEELRLAQREEYRVLATRGATTAEIAEYQRLRGKQLRDEQQMISQRITTSERLNDETLVDLADQTFRDLYHEVFHAYLESCVFPQNRFDVPLWLNEGLAQTFETARIVDGRLSTDAGPSRRGAAQRLAADLLGPDPLTLADVLRAGTERFLHVAPLDVARDRRAAAEAARYYLYAWGLADYLTYQCKLVSTETLTEYVTRFEDDPRSPVERFERLMGRPLAEVEREWTEHIRLLAEPPRAE